MSGYKEDIVLLSLALDEAKGLLEYLKLKSYRDLHKWHVARAVTKSLENIGEWTGKVSKDCRRRYPKFPWRNSKDLKNVLAHDYDEVLLEKVWNVVRYHLPELEKKLHDIVINEKLQNNIQDRKEVYAKREKKRSTARRLKL